MRKVCLLVDECVPGMRLASDVINMFGTIIATKGTYIDERLYKKLTLNKVEMIFVYSAEDENSCRYEKKIFIDNYEFSLKQLKGIVKNIYNGREVKAETFQGISNDLFCMVNNIPAGDAFDYIKAIKSEKDTDNYSYNHTLNVSLLSMMFGKWLKLSKEEILKLGLSGLLHDIGKIFIPRQILTKAGGLSTSEFDLVKKHSEIGYNYVKKIDGICEAVALGILMHHEREDGSGYPYGYKGDKIHQYGKIIGICDIYDAMTSDRTYKCAESPFKVIEMFQKNCFKILDTDLLYTFLKNITSFYVGDEVLLNTGEKARICFINPFNVSRPIVKSNDNFINLSDKSDISIKNLSAMNM